MRCDDGPEDPLLAWQAAVISQLFSDGSFWMKSCANPHGRGIYIRPGNYLGRKRLYEGCRVLYQYGHDGSAVAR